MHDCDANPGLVTRKLAPFAKSISVAFDVEKEKLNNDNCFVNGNPIRPQFRTLTKDRAREVLGLKNKLTLCVMGGSQGAKKINETVAKILKNLCQDWDLQVMFQTGKKNFQDVVNLLKIYYPE